MSPHPKKQRAKRKAWLLLAFLVWFSFVLGAASSAARQGIEQKVKAAFVYNFAKFAVWPENAFSSDDEALTLCLAGDSPLVDALQESMVGRTAQGRGIRLQSFAGDDPPRSCRIVFVDASRDAQVAHILQNLRSRAVLSIGESAAFAASGGIIRLVAEAGKIRFDINVHSANQAGIRLRSQLLTLARHVEQ